MTTYAFPALSRSAPYSVEFGLKSNTQVFTSPLNGSVQTLELLGARWAETFTWQNLQGADAELIKSLLTKLRGQANRVSKTPYERPAPQGTINLAGVTVNGAVAQFAASANLSGCGIGKTFADGDYFSVAGELKRCTAAFTADGSGNMTGVTFEPPVRAAAGWANTAAVTTNAPTALFIPSDPHVKWQGKPGGPNGVMYDIAFDLVEVFS